MTLDYATLRIVWWVLLAALLIGFAVMDGFDLGVATLLPFVARTDLERRIVINTVGPVWEGNQVWLILGGGAIFAAWPALYAATFSGFYFAMFLVLAALILRPVGFKFRSKVDDPRWRSVWDWCLFVGGVVPAVVFGVAVGNVFEGVPFRYDDSLRMTYEGDLFGLLNPFALLCGGVSASMLVFHGSNYLAIKTTGSISSRTVRAGRWAAIVLIVLFSSAGVWVSQLGGHVVTASLGMNGPSNPTSKQVAVATGAWLANYGRVPSALLAPVGTYLAVIVAFFLSWRARPGLAFVFSGIAVTGVIATAGVSLFPFMLPSSLDPNVGLTVFDASSSRHTLLIMLVATLIFLPLVLFYTTVVYRVLRGKVTAEWIEAHGKALY